jgi:uncharacterized protein (TIGR03437 family)
VVSAADGNGLSPGALASVFGRNFGDNAEVLVEYKPAPVLFRNSGQINFQIPWEMAPGPVNVQVRSRGVSSPAVKVNLTDASPAAFRYRGVAMITDSDGRPVGHDQEALTPGRPYTLSLTGCGPVTPPVATGQPSPADPLALTYLTVRLAFGGQEAEVLSSSMTPDLIGVCQVSFIMPGTSTGMNPERVNGEISIGTMASRFEVFTN